MADLLLELFSEEIPARMQVQACADLKRLVTDGLVEAGLTYESAAAFATPRRLCLAVVGLTGESRAVSEERKGPRVEAPEAALEGFLRSSGLTREQLVAREDKKGAVWFGVVERPGRKASDIVAEVVPAVIRGFPWPKSMRWGSGALRWVRPLQSILCVLSDEAGVEVVPFEVDGIVAGAVTSGHRFMAPGKISVSGFEDYSAKLRKAFVVLDAAARAEHIWADATNMAFAQGLEVVEDKGLLAEVAGLVEWPVVLMGGIGETFLGLPPEVLQTSMREHQKFFSVRNPKTGRIEKYVTVANRETADNGATILAGNGKVLAARLSDAKFFWENDLRTVKSVGLEGMAAPLAQVTFHNKLGSQADRVARIAALAREIAPLVGAVPDLAEQAAKVAKADLCSAMVGEFPELQGLMGRYYAAAAGLDLAVVAACEEHYSPLGPGDKVPSAPVSVAVALTDKIDTLTGFWAIDEKPTGSKDPYALRRAALGLIRLVLENGVRVSTLQNISNALALVYPIETLRVELADHVKTLREAEAKLGKFETLIVRINEPAFQVVAEEYANRLDRDLEDSRNHVARLELAVTLYESVRNALPSNLLAFLHDRLKVYLRDRGIRHDVIDACLAMPKADDLTLLVARVTALQGVLDGADGANLVQGYKRANNILAAEEKKDGVEYSLDPDVRLAEDGAEKALFAALDVAEGLIGPALKAEDFGAAMSAMAALRGPIDGFFDGVMVNAENSMVRRNRLCLLHRIRRVMGQVAEFSVVEG